LGIGQEDDKGANPQFKQNPTSGAKMTFSHGKGVHREERIKDLVEMVFANAG
jgi:hypothetical protein